MLSENDHMQQADHSSSPVPVQAGGPAKGGFVVTFVAFAGAFLATMAVTALGLALVVLLVKTQSEGEAQFWLGLVGELLVTVLFLVSWPVLTYQVVKRALARKGYAESARTAMMCATMLPLGVLIVTLPFIPFMARKTALAGAGIKNKFLRAASVIVILVLAVAVPVLMGRMSENSKQKAIYARETTEKDRVFGDQFQLVKTIQTASEPYHNLEFTFTGAGTYGQLLSSLQDDLHKGGYSVESRQNWSLNGESEQVDCEKGQTWQCTLSADARGKFSMSIVITVPASALPARGAITGTSPHATSPTSTSQLDLNAPVEQFAVMITELSQ
jgi:hypothetical protein